MRREIKRNAVREDKRVYGKEEVIGWEGRSGWVGWARRKKEGREGEEGEGQGATDSVTEALLRSHMRRSGVSGAWDSGKGTRKWTGRHECSIKREKRQG